MLHFLFFRARKYPPLLLPARGTGARRDLTQHVTDWHWRAMPLREFPAMPQGLAGCPMDPSSQLAPAGTPPSAANRLARLLFCVSSSPPAPPRTLFSGKTMKNSRFIRWTFHSITDPIATAVRSPNNETTFARVTVATLPTVHNTAARCHQRRRYHSLFTTLAVTTYIYTLLLREIS